MLTVTHHGGRIAFTRKERSARLYAKVFTSLWDGTLYGKTDAQLVFIFLLAHADPDGEVRVVAEAIAGATGISLENVRSAIAYLESPEPGSGSEDREGRRIERIGDADRWQVTNYVKYRGLRDEMERRRQTKEATKRWRAKVSRGEPSKSSVSRGEPQRAHREGEGEGEGEVIVSASQKLVTRDQSDGKNLTIEDWFATCFWPEYPRHAGVSRAKALLELERVFKAAGKAKEDDTAEAIMAGLARHRQLWNGKEPEFIPHPATWIHQRRWEDET
jgi:hypothetical protein